MTTRPEWGDLVADNARRIARWARGVATVDEDDLAQEGWAAILEGMRRDSWPRDPSPGFVASVAIRAMAKAVRRASRRRLHHLEERIAAARGRDAAVAIDVAEAVATLSPKLGSTVLDRWYGGATAVEIADAEGVAEGAVNARCSRAYRALAAVLSGYAPERPPIPPRYGAKARPSYHKPRPRRIRTTAEAPT